MRAQEFVVENWGVSKEPIPLPIGNYLGPESDEFAPPGNYQDVGILHDEVEELIDAGVDPQVVNIDPRTVLATQDWLSNAGGDDPLFDEYPDRPVIYQKAGKLYILDGHHRTTRAWKAGRPIGVYLFSDQQQQNLDESAGSYREIEFVCANPDFCDATDPEQQQQLHQQLRKIPGVIPVYQDQSDYSAGQFSLSAIYKTAEQRRQIMAAARALGVAVDLVQPVDDDYIDRAVRGELEGQIQENVYDVLQPLNCGPFDGGCVLVAQALQQIHGGRVVVLVDADDRAQHAAVLADGQLIDYDGAADPKEFVQQFEQNERVRIQGIRPIRDTDLPDAPRDAKLIPQIVQALSENSESDTAPNIKLEILQKLQQMPLTVFGSAATRDVAQAKDFDVFLDLDANPEHKKYLKPVLNLSYNYYGWIDPFVIKDGVLYVRNDTATGWTRAKNAQAILKNIRAQGRPIDQIQENFADGKKPGRKGLSKRVGIPRKASLSQLQKIASNSTGERRRMAQWQLNMRRGKAKKNK